MLQSIRNRAQGLLAWIVLILISVPFAFWGIQNYFGTGQEQPVVVVGDKEIFQRDVTRAYEQMAAKLGSIGQINEESLKKLAIKNLIDEELLTQAVEERGYAVSDAQIRNAIREISVFHVDGKFDKGKFEIVLKTQRISEEGLVENLRRSLEIGQFSDGVTRTSFVTNAEIDRFLRLRDQTRSTEYIIVPVKAVSEEITHDQIEQHYKDHITLFRNPEQVSIDYIQLSVDDVAKKIEVTEEELISTYESQLDLYTKKERRKVSHILAVIDSNAGENTADSALKKIREAKARLDSGGAFEVVAKEMSDDTVSGSKGGDLGLINPKDMDIVFEKAAFALSLGEVTAPVKTPFGYHLIKLTELEPGKVKPFEEVRSEVEKAYRRQSAENDFYETAEKLSQVSYESPDSLEPAANATGLKIQQSALFSLQQGEGVAVAQPVRDAAFVNDVLEGKNSESVELGQDKIVVLRVNKRLLATDKPLADVKQEITDKLRTDQAKQNAKNLAETFIAKLKEGQKLSDLAVSSGLELKRYESITREDSEVPWQFKAALFKAARPGKGVATPLVVALKDGQQIVGHLFAVKDSAPKDVDDYQKEKKLAQTWLSEQHGNAEFSALLSQLRDSSKIVIRDNQQ